MYTTLFLLAAIGLGMNFFIRRIESKSNSVTIVPDNYRKPIEALLKIDTKQVLHSWGRLASMRDCSFAGPIHASILQYLEKYETIGPDVYLMVMNRKLAEHPFKDNAEFTQIGEWGSGEEIVVRRDESDFHVYIVPSEDMEAGTPQILANSFDLYLSTAWLYFEGSKE